MGARSGPLWCAGASLLPDCTVGMAASRGDASVSGGLGGHQGAEEERVDDRSEAGDAGDRIRAVIDAGEAVVAHVLEAGAAEGKHKPVGRPSGTWLSSSTP